MKDDRFDAWLRQHAPTAPHLDAQGRHALHEKISRIPSKADRRWIRWAPPMALAAGLLVVWIEPRLRGPTREEQAIEAIATAYDAWLDEEQEREEGGYLLTVLDVEETEP